jgi:hypothetical protein
MRRPARWSPAGHGEISPKDQERRFAPDRSPRLRGSRTAGSGRARSRARERARGGQRFGEAWEALSERLLSGLTMKRRGRPGLYDAAKRGSEDEKRGLSKLCGNAGSGVCLRRDNSLSGVGFGRFLAKPVPPTALPSPSCPPDRASATPPRASSPVRYWTGDFGERAGLPPLPGLEPLVGSGSTGRRSAKLQDRAVGTERAGPEMSCTRRWRVAGNRWRNARRR